jgi:flagellar hook-length control protein FliK
MPEIAVAANIAAVAKAASGTESSSASAAPGDDAASGGPFAKVLQQQMDTPDTNKAKTADPADPADVAVTATDAATANDLLPTNLAAFLPMLMGSAAMADGTTAQPTAQGAKPTTGTDNTKKDAATAIPLIALPATTGSGASTAPVAETAVKTTTQTTGNPGTPTATTPAPATANLAAAPDSAGDAKPAAKAGQTFNALVANNLGSTEPTPAATAHAAAAATAISAATAGTAASATAAVHSQVVASAVGSQAWSTDVGNHLVWMTNNQTSRADLVLTPPQLGKIEISVSLSGHQATASFVSANPEVRHAIENAIPRLREILADAGVTLGQTQVGSDAPRQETGQFRDNSYVSPTAVSSIGLRVSASGGASWTGAGRGLVDVFA